MTSPTVSVLVPLYNCEEFLPYTFESLRKQSFVDFEVIAIDDGSTDGTGTLLDKFAAVDSRIKAVHTKNNGIVAALNAAASVARGTYLARLDGDDLAHEKRLALQVGFLNSDLSCVCVGSLYRMIDENGKVFAEQAAFRNFRQTDLNAFPPHVASPPHPSVMMRRTAFDQSGGYRSAFPHAEDHDLFLRLSRLGRIDVIQAPLLDYRIHRKSLSSANLERQIDSALCAVLSAICVERGHRDPAEYLPQPTREQYYEVIADPTFKALFEDYRRLAQARGEMNRRRTGPALRKLLPLLLNLVGRLPGNMGDPRFLGLLKATSRSTIRLALRRV